MGLSFKVSVLHFEHVTVKAWAGIFVGSLGGVR